MKSAFIVRQPCLFFVSFLPVYAVGQVAQFPSPVVPTESDPL